MKQLFFILLTVITFSCNSSTSSSVAPHYQAVNTIADAIMYIEAFQGKAEDFRLVLDELVSFSGKDLKCDYAVKLIEKKVADSKGWAFDGYTLKEGKRVYKFKKS